MRPLSYGASPILRDHAAFGSDHCPACANAPRRAGHRHAACGPNGDAPRGGDERSHSYGGAAYADPACASAVYGAQPMAVHRDASARHVNPVSNLDARPDVRSTADLLALAHLAGRAIRYAALHVCALGYQ